MSINRRILVNSIETPDGTILTSNYTHDYNYHIDKNGERYMVDGGVDYLKRSKNVIPYKELSLYSDSDFIIVRERFKRWDGLTHRYVCLCDIN